VGIENILVGGALSADTAPASDGQEYYSPWPGNSPRPSKRKIADYVPRFEFFRKRLYEDEKEKGERK